MPMAMAYRTAGTARRTTRTASRSVTELCLEESPAERPGIASGPRHQFFPHTFCLAAEYDAGIGFGDDPQAAFDFLFELAGHPAHEADEIARLVWRLLHDPVDDFGFARDVQVTRELQRLAARIAAHHHEQGIEHLRTAEVDGSRHLFRGRMVGKQCRQLDVGGTVEDETDVLAIHGH